MVTDKAETIKKGPLIADTIADHLAEKAIHPGAADIPTAQADTINTTTMDHHTGTNRYRQSPTPCAHQISSITTAVQEPSEASSSGTDDK